MNLEYCADAIALYENKLVLVERLNFPKGIALPGGRRDYVKGKLEDIAVCAVREFEEETGLRLTIEGTLGTYAAPDRDPRGPKISTVVYGKATGEIRNEEGKTSVMLMRIEDIEKNKDRFAFDHYKILQDWLRNKMKK